MVVTLACRAVVTRPHDVKDRHSVPFPVLAVVSVQCAMKLPMLSWAWKQGTVGGRRRPRCTSKLSRTPDLMFVGLVAIGQLQISTTWEHVFGRLLSCRR